MKKFLPICLLAFCLAFYACEKDEKKPPLAEGTLYVYNIFLDNEPESVTFTLEGEFPRETQEKGSFSGSLTVKESDGTKHTYKGLQFCYSGGKLLLHDSKDAFADSTVLCWVDPKAPEDLIIVDQTFAKPNPTQELIAYVNSDLSDPEARSLGAQINRIAGVQEAVFVSAEARLEEFIADHENDSAFLGVEPSDLRDSYRITILSETAEETAKQVRAIPGIEAVNTQLMTAVCTRILVPKKDGEELQSLLASLFFPENIDLS